MQESKKAFRAIFKRNDLEAAIGALSNLKGVGPAMASAVLAAGCPELAPFMADECLLSMEGTEGIDYTMKEYMKLVAKTKQTVNRLNEQGGSWNPHTVELAVWTHYVARDLKPEILEDMPSKHETKADRFNGDIEDDIIIPPVNGEVSEDSRPETEEIEAEPVKNGVEVSEEVQKEPEEVPVTNGEVTEETAVVREVTEDIPVAVSSEVPSNGIQESSEVPTEASDSSGVPVEVFTNGTSANGTSNGTDRETHAEVPAVNNGDHDHNVEVTQQAVEPIAIIAAAKRPLEDAADIEAAAPEMKRVREEAVEDDELVETANSPAPMTSGEVAVVTSPSQPILTGGD
jgi:hypothetical protein